MATVTGAKLALCTTGDSVVPLQGTDFEKNVTKVTIVYPTTGTPTYQWEGKIYKAGKNKKAAEAKVTQTKRVAEKDNKDTTGDVTVTIDSSNVQAPADIYTE